MSMSSNSPSADRRQRPVRKVPRRHSDAVQKASASYDGGEFPVLLRMPDVSTNEMPTSELAVAAIEETEPVEQVQQVEPAEKVKSPSSRRHSRKHARHHSEESSPDDSRRTAIASKQFWMALAPKIAVGGMLLSVLAISGFILMRPRNQTSTMGLSTSGWKVDQKENTAPKEFSAPTNPIALDANPSRHDDWQGAQESIAAKPDIQPTRPHDHQDSVLPVRDSSIPQLESGVVKPEGMQKSQQGGSYYPDDQEPTPANEESRVTPKSSEESFHAQGWPDESDARGGDADSNADVGMEQGPQLNSAMQSQTRTSFLPKRAPVNSPALETNGSRTRLNGTVDFPNPRKTGYR